MPVEIMYILVVFAVIIVWFSFLKRPLYESMFVSFLVLVLCTGRIEKIGTYVWEAMQESSLYVIITFVVSSFLLSKTTIIDDCISIILAIFGKVRGGAGMVAIIGSAYMGSLSGSGPGNVATTGVFTIPAMKKSGFPPHLAANVEAHSSTMGNMIPPAGMIAIAFAILDGLYPNTYTISQYWMLLWGIAIWFVMQRIVTLFIMCCYYKVEPINKEEIPDLKETIKRGWKAVFLPIIVFLPFFLTNTFSDFFVNRLGSGASAFNSSILLFMPSLIVVCGILLSGKNTIKKMKISYIFEQVAEHISKVVPTSALVLFAYFVSNVFYDIKVENAIGDLIDVMDLSLLELAFVIPLFTTLLGMIIPGSTQIKIFGGIIISCLAAVGCNPMLAAGMLPCICGATHGVTPPYCTCVYVAMGIADAELKPTLKNNMIWILIHYILSVLMILGMVPVFGLVR